MFRKQVLMGVVIFGLGCGTEDTNTPILNQVTLTQTAGMPTEAQCPNGGVLLHHGVDENGDGTLDEAEVDQIYPVCNGVDGVDGMNGTDGSDGAAGMDVDGETLAALQAQIEMMSAEIERLKMDHESEIAALREALNTGLATKADTVTLAAVATSGAYADLVETPATITDAQAMAIVENTQKTGITAAQALSIEQNAMKTGITSEQSAAILTNSNKIGITAEQIAEIATNTLRLDNLPSFEGWDRDASDDFDGAYLSLSGLPTTITIEQAEAIVENTAKNGISEAQAYDITVNNSKTGISEEQAAAIVANSAKTGLTDAQAYAITANSEKVGLTAAQAAAIEVNTNKVGITEAEKAAIAGIPDFTGWDKNAADDFNGRYTSLIDGPVTITADQAAAIATNTAKVGISAAQSNLIADNAAKVAALPDFTGWDKDVSDDFDGQYGSLTDRPALPQISDDLVALSQYLKVSDQTVRFVGANVMIQNGTDSTYCPAEEINGEWVYDCNGLGNLFIGYNEAPKPGAMPDDATVADRRTGSHNLVVGRGHQFIAHAGLVAGADNSLESTAGSVVGGTRNVSTGFFSSILGGSFNRTVGVHSSVAGGFMNTAQAQVSGVLGGRSNTVNASYSVVVGGESNDVDGPLSVQVGGQQNTISDTSWVGVGVGGQANTVVAWFSTILSGKENRSEGMHSVVLSGEGNRSEAPYSVVVSGKLNTTRGQYSAIGGGERNETSGLNAVITGGLENTNAVGHTVVP